LFAGELFGTSSIDVLLVVDHPRVEEKLILRELKSIGLRVGLLNPRVSPVQIGGFSAPAVSLVRTVSMFNGLRAAAALESQDSHVVNSSYTIIACGDKAVGYAKLASAGLPIPRTYLAFSMEAAAKAFEEVGGVAVDKPPVGSWGRMVSLVRSRRLLKYIAEAREEMSGSVRGHLIQQYIETKGRDLRCLVVGDRVLGCVERVARGDWRSNVALGASARPHELSSELEELALKAAEAVQGEFISVDFLVDSSTYVNEVNGTPEFKGFMAATGVNVARKLAEHVKERLRA